MVAAARRIEQVLSRRGDSAGERRGPVPTDRKTRYLYILHARTLVRGQGMQYRRSIAAAEFARVKRLAVMRRI